MRDSVRAAFVGFTSAYEGVVPWMYQDVKGLVTVAIGNLIDPIQYALPLPFVDRVTGQPATRDSIMREWMRVKGDASLAKLGHRAAERVTNLRLDADGVALVVSRKLAQMDQQLAVRFGAWESWPACSQLATLSMSWACGAAFAFPRLEAALRSIDWDGAASECTIAEAGNPGVKPRNVANRRLYRNAARLEPDALDWTHDPPTNPASEPTVIVHVDPSLYHLEDEPPDTEPA